jgi:hypothetical protein
MFRPPFVERENGFWYLQEIINGPYTVPNKRSQHPPNPYNKSLDTHTHTHTLFNIIFSSVMSCVGLAVTYCFFFLQLLCYRYCCLASAAGYAYFKFITGY